MLVAVADGAMGRTIAFTLDVAAVTTDAAYVAV